MNSAERIFQHYEGVVDALKGAKLDELYALRDRTRDKEDIILLWIKIQGQQWVRIFIDGVYCGMDISAIQEMETDLVDDCFFTSHHDWVAGKVIENAEVSCVELPEIKLSIRFQDQSVLQLACLKAERCVLTYFSLSPSENSIR